VTGVQTCALPIWMMISFPCLALLEVARVRQRKL
jgi:hypothetical protein